MNRYAAFAEPWRHHEMSMDLRHAAAIGRFLSSLPMLSSVVEVGCCFGVSTAEVLAACESQRASLTLIDIAFQDSIRQMVAAAAGSVAVTMSADPSASVLARYATPQSAVILDGDHRQSYMELEDEILVKVQPRAIILHDVISFRPDTDGPRWFLHRWQSRGYLVAIDYLPREGERTDRGLAILCSSPADAVLAMEAFR